MRALCVHQLFALFRKEIITRRRSWFASIIEFIVPVLLVYIFVYGAPKPTKTSSLPRPSNSSKGVHRLSESFHGKVFFTGNFQAEELMNDIANNDDHYFNSFEAIKVPSEDQLEIKAAYEKQVGIVFSQVSSGKADLNYTIRPYILAFPNPDGLFGDYSIFYWIDKFTNLQWLVNKQLLKGKASDALLHAPYLLSLEDTKISPEPLNDMAIQLLILAFVTGNTIHMITAGKRIILEKEKGSRELLRVMGVPDTIYWVTQFFNYFFLQAVQALCSALIINNLFIGDGSSTDLAKLFIVIITFYIFSLFLTFALTTLIQKAIFLRVAITAVSLGGMMSGLDPRGNIQSFNVISYIFLPSSAFQTALRAILEGVYSGRTTSLLLVMMAGSIIYFIVTLYLDATCPWQKGTPRPWYFPIISFLPQRQTQDIEKIQPLNRSKLLEEASKGKPKIVCDNLSRSFGWLGVYKRAVDEMFLTINQGELTILLGHNGAGKTTLMSLITGFIRPSSGTVYVNGYDIRKQLLAARRSIALCPQQDLLYENLTVFENLYLCASLRGIYGSSAYDLIIRLTRSLKMDEKADCLASQLSGGMRRRLQLAMAMATQSDTLILDEPTSGLDPETRRLVWDYLLSLRRTHTILLSTHSMEEADALGDRIVIISGGRVKCSGSPLFLKTNLGAGYMIKMAKTNYNHAFTLDLVKKYFPQSTISSQTDTEIAFLLSESNRDKNSQFPHKIADMCDELDGNKTLCGISSYTISMTTLEDVFLKVAVEEGLVSSDKVMFSQCSKDAPPILSTRFNFKNISRITLLKRHLYALCIKRFHCSRKDLHSLIYQLILPNFFLLLVFFVFRANVFDIPAQRTFVRYPISPELYKGAALKLLFSSVDNSLKNCFSLVHQPFEKDIIVTELSVAEYFKKNPQMNPVEFLFGIEHTPEALTIMYSPSATYSLPISINSYFNTLKCVFTKDLSPITLFEHPLPDSPDMENFYRITFKSLLFISVLFPIPLSFLAASYFSFPATEYHTKAKLVQKIAGVGDEMYWASNFLFDFMFHFFASLPVFLIIVLANQVLLSSFEIMTAVFILLILTGFAAIPLAYLATFLRLNPSSGFTLVETVYGVVGVIFPIVYILANEITFLKAFLPNIHTWSWLLEILPVSAFAIAFGKITKAFVIVRCCSDMKTEFRAASLHQSLIDLSYVKKYCLEGEPVKYFTLISPELLIIGLTGLTCLLIILILEKYSYKIYKLLLFFVETALPPSTSKSIAEDEDVAAERQYVRDTIQNGNIDLEALVVDGLTKNYISWNLKKFKAVDNLSFTVRRKECFGLLGVNGAGKTTTFSMLTGDLPITSGNAYLNNLSVEKDFSKYRKSISYCPQYDALLPLLNPTETLTLFARLKGFPSDRVDEVVDRLIKSTDLQMFQKTMSKNLSGGNKRKLSLAITAIGGPPVIFLDEPTTGVDPASRRMIWSTLIGLRESGQTSIVLTSHSMDECESLCSRIGIMANGRFKCLGSTTYLKGKYGQGFVLTVKIAQATDAIFVDEFVQEAFPGAITIDKHETLLQYHLKDPSLSWGTLFRTMGLAQERLPIENFTICDTSIEQIFLMFAKIP